MFINLDTFINGRHSRRDLLESSKKY